MRRNWSGAGSRTWRWATLLLALGLLFAACGGDDSGSTTTTAGENGGGTTTTAGGDTSNVTLKVAIVDNPQMQDIATLTPDYFTAQSGINIEYTVLDEQTLREVTTRDVGAGGQQFDVVMIGMYEAPQFGENGWLYDLDKWAVDDAAYNKGDLIPAVVSGLSTDTGFWASPFYAESSFTMYRKDVLDAAGITMPDEPTWDDIASIAAQVDSDQMAGICLRGKPGWGDLGAAFTTVLNTFGGTWWLANADGSIGAAQVDQPAFKDALTFYVNLVDSYGEDDAANSSFNECLTQFKDGKVAMWYDATVAAGLLEANDSPVKGLNGYALAPVKETAASGWLWSWALAIPQTSSNPDAAWKYVSWATGPDYLVTAGENLPGGWAAVPPGTRQSLYANPNYQEAASAFAQKTLDAMLAAPIDSPGTTPRPGLPGVQFVGVPEFQDTGTRCTEQFSAAIAGNISIDDALSACQAIASEYSTGG
ncbi:MAG: extracellular solute-binding protein [Acidimicrobiia bacterium]